jgi:predicted TIM-barrel fold metal-dependent hydrolase
LTTSTQIFTGANRLSGLAAGCLDAHAHVFQQNLPMVSDRRYSPVADARINDLVTLLTEHALAGALLVQPSFLGTDNDYLLQSLAQAAELAPEQRFFGVAVLDADFNGPDLQLLDRNGIIGCRLNLMGREEQFRLEHWRSVLASVDDLNWHVEVHARAAYLPDIVRQLAPVVRTIVVDHFGLPAYSTSGPVLPTWIADKSAECLMVKLSAPYRFLPRSAAAAMAGQCRDLVSYLESELGANNLMWGSDWPWTQFEDSVSYEAAIGWRNAWAAQLQS